MMPRKRPLPGNLGPARSRGQSGRVQRGQLRPSFLPKHLVMGVRQAAIERG